MAFLSRVGNLLKQSGSKHANMGLSSSNSPLFQAIRSMSSAKLFVGGLAYATDEMGLREAFQQYGEVIDARVITDRDSGRSRGFGFVSFTSADAANTALQDMDGKELHGRRIRVNFAQERPRPSFGGGGYGGSAGGGGYGGSAGGGGYGSTGVYGGGSYGSSGGYGGGGYGGGDGGNSSNISGYGGGNHNVANADDRFSGVLGGGSGIPSGGQSESYGAPPGGNEDIDGDLEQDLADESRDDNEEDDYANTSNK